LLAAAFDAPKEFMFKNLNTSALGFSGHSSEIIELALSNQFKGIDLDLLEFARQVESRGLGPAKRLIDSARLRIGSFVLPVAWEGDADAYKRDMDGLAKYAEMAQQVGCTRMTTNIEPAGDMRPYHENFELHRRRFGELGDALSKHGIRLGVGFFAPAKLREGRAFQFIQTVDAVVMLLRSIASPHVGLALDTWHWHVGAGTLDQLRALGGNNVITVSLADADPDVTATSADESDRKLPGETDVIDNAAILSYLAETGYEGPVTPRPHPTQFPGVGRDKIVKAAATALDQVWKAAGLGPSGRVMIATK
jgi:sugar phosphate isomerase/epimerase